MTKTNKSTTEITLNPKASLDISLDKKDVAGIIVFQKQENLLKDISDIDEEMKKLNIQCKKYPYDNSTISLEGISFQEYVENNSTKSSWETLKHFLHIVNYSSKYEEVELYNISKLEKAKHASLVRNKKITYKIGSTEMVKEPIDIGLTRKIHISKHFDIEGYSGELYKLVEVTYTKKLDNTMNKLIKDYNNIMSKKIKKFKELFLKKNNLEAELILCSDDRYITHKMVSSLINNSVENKKLLSQFTN